jgi:hypothetical protein
MKVLNNERKGLEFADSLTSGLPSTHEFAQVAPSLPWRGPLTGPLVAGFCHTGKPPRIT